MNRTHYAGQFARRTRAAPVLCIFAIIVLLGLGAPAVPAQEQLGYEELLSRAWENSAALAMREAARRSARASVREAEAARFPTLTGRMSGSYRANPADAVEVPRGGLSEGLVETPSPGDPPILIPREDLTFIEAGEHPEYAGSLSLRQPLFTWGRISNSVALAELQMRIASMRRADERDTLARTVAGNVYAIRQTHRLISLMDEQIASVEELTSIVEQSEAQGAASRLELLDQRESVLQTRQARARIQRQQEQFLAELRSLTGIESLTAGRIGFELPAERPSALPRPDAEELGRLVLNRNRYLTLLGEQHRARQLEQEIAEADRPFRPDIAAIAELQGTTSRLPLIQDEWDDQGNWQARIGIVVEGSLFDGGAARAQAGAREAQAAETRFERLDAIQQIQREIGAASARLRSLSEEIDLQAERVSLEEERLEIIETQVASGAATESALIARRIALLQARTERSRLELDYLNQYFQALSFLPVDAWPSGVLPE